MIEMMGVGGRGTETTVLLRFNNAKHKEGTGYLKVGPGYPCPVLQHPSLLSLLFFRRWGITLLVENIYWLLEDVARRPPSYYDTTVPTH